jgi:hypothetical protein
MPVKLRRPKIRTSQITDEARAIYARAVELQGIYKACIRDDICRSTSLNQHCAECSKFLDLNRELDRMLGLKPWEMSPLDTNSATPPDYKRSDPSKVKDWRKAWELRCELQK